MPKEIVDHDEGNAGLEKVHSLCMPHGVGADSHTCQSGHSIRGPAQVLQQNVSRAVSAQAASLPVLQEWLVVVELTPPRRKGAVGPAVPIGAAVGIIARGGPYREHRRMAAIPDESHAVSDPAVPGMRAPVS